MGIKNRHEAEQVTEYFFSRFTLRFFDSRIGKFYPTPDGAYFVTSERFDYESPRMWTVRHITDAGAVTTVGEFQQHANRRTANAHAKQAAQAAHAVHERNVTGEADAARLREAQQREALGGRTPVMTPRGLPSDRGMYGSTGDRAAWQDPDAHRTPGMWRTRAHP
jgi:hypothetical protein